MLDPEYGYKGPAVSAHDAIEQANSKYEEMVRTELENTRELPIVDVPATLGDSARTSVEVGDRIIRKAHTHSFIFHWLPGQFERIFRQHVEENEG